MRNATVYRMRLCLKALLVIFSISAFSTSAQEKTPSPLPEEQIRAISARILKKADKADCEPRDCRIIVANFVFSSGLTSQLGKELADQFAREFALQRNALQVIDRSKLDSVLEEQRIPGASLNNEGTMRWLGQAVGATVVLTGVLEGSGTSLKLKAHLLSCSKDKAGPEESLTFSYSGPPSDLDPMETFSQQPPSTGVFADSSIRQPGRSVTQPTCIYCPNPNYTDAARAAKFSGSVILEVVVSEQGQPVKARIIRGIPYGLSEASVDTVLHNWKFKPALLNGQPIPVKVPIEVAFRIR